MEDKTERIGRFLAACDALIGGTYREAVPRISAILMELAESEELTGLFEAVTSEFDYAATKGFYLRESGGRRGTVYLPASRADSLAFVFCLLAEIDSGRMPFNDFLLRYFYVDGSYTASFSLFAERIMTPFRDIVREAYPACAVYATPEAPRPAPDPLEEKTVKKNIIYAGKIVTLRCDDALLPDGRNCKREIVEHPGGAAVLCVSGGRVALVRQFRYAYGEELLEIPAGKLERGEDPTLAAERELGEETGFTAEKLELLTVLYPSPGYTNEKLYIYEASGIGVGKRHPDGDEFLNVEYLSLGDAYAMIERGELRDAKTVTALLLYRNKHGDRS